MPKALTIISLAVAGILLLVFGADLVLGFPFKKASYWIDIGFVLCALVLAYLSWTVYREQR